MGRAGWRRKKDHERRLFRHPVPDRRGGLSSMAFTTRADFDQRAATRLAPFDAVFADIVRTDHDLNPNWPAPEKKIYRKAAVLVGLIDRGDDYGVLLTLRPESMAE